MRQFIKMLCSCRGIDAQIKRSKIIVFSKINPDVVVIIALFFFLFLFVRVGLKPIKL